jgi:hypothetical protein
MKNRWVIFGIGFWTLISPWLLGFSAISLAKWSAVIVGTGLVLMMLWDKPAESNAGTKVDESK